MKTPSALFNPLRIGAFEVPNRVLMAPLTRNRADADGTPRAIAAEYYRQRSSAGLIVTEATPPPGATKASDVLPSSMGSSMSLLRAGCCRCPWCRYRSVNSLTG